MPLPLPKLDDRTFEDLVSEGVHLTPLVAPHWTDHNAHDPGVTLLQLLAWLAEQQSYRLDRTTDACYRAFLRLLGIERAPPGVAEVVVEVSLAGGATRGLPAGLQLIDEADVVFETTAPLTPSLARLVNVTAGGDVTSTNDDPVATFMPFGERPERESELVLRFDNELGPTGQPVAFHVWAIEAAAVRGPLDHYSAKVTWEYADPSNVWAPLGEVQDETRALSTSGFVRFHVPEPGVTVVRCRLERGGYECPPELRRVALNAVPARHAKSIGPQVLGQSDGTAGQAFVLSEASPIAGSAVVRVDGGDPWLERSEWDQTGPHDLAFRLAIVRAEVQFGNGRAGRVPAAGATIECRYAVGGGDSGNVGPHTLSSFAATGRNEMLVAGWSTLSRLVTVAQPFAASGGADAETLADAQGRAIAFLEKRFRAVTLGDYETLALETPGVPVASAKALAAYHPDLPCAEADGCVTVVAVPHCPTARPNPGADFLRAVKCWLLPRIPIATELHVVGPGLAEVIVSARLIVSACADLVEVEAAVRARLDAFFHPLTGGPRGAGWPIGRYVYRTEVLAVLSALEGVEYVDRFGLCSQQGDIPRCDNLPICPNDLVVSGHHQLELRSTREPND